MGVRYPVTIKLKLSMCISININTMFKLPPRNSIVGSTEPALTCLQKNEQKRGLNLGRTRLALLD